MQTGLSGKVVIVTGATANIGRGIALAFAEEGACVAVVGRDSIAGEEVVRLARERGAADAWWQPADVTVEEDVRTMVAAVAARHGRIDVLVNNVGGNLSVGPFASSTPAEWRHDLELNLVSMFACTHAVLPHLEQRGEGRIVNIGSTAGFIGDRLLAVYSAAKGGVHTFTKVLALELGTTGITVNAVAPYNTRSEDPYSDMSSGSRVRPGSGVFALAREKDPQAFESIKRHTALTRQQARPHEIGAAAVYLASDQAAFVTGHVLGVDGGATLV
jgi:2-hydroxycyclohexanecarboxyl-CoA dehydrogenase